MTAIVEVLNSPQLRQTLIVLVPVLVLLLKQLGPTLDVTTWPRPLQPLLPLLLAGLPVFGAQLSDGVSLGSAALAALVIGLEAIGAYHVGKRLLSGKRGAA